MGGYGSGRPAHKQKAEDCRSIDVNRLNREGCLNPGKMGNWVWSRDGEEVARIGYRADQNRFTLDYRVRSYGADWVSVTEPVTILWVACHYGGERPYFLCPGVVAGTACHRRVGKLFAGGKYFLCRHCYNVAYASQSHKPYDRTLSRANKLRMALGGEPGTANWIADKPKGMWWRTYERKCLAIEHYEHQADRQFLSKFGGLLSKDELRTFFG